MGKKVLDVKNLTIQYRTDLETVHAVNGISFSLEKGETLGLVGETGAGKTTTALGIMGLLPERTAVIPEGSIEFEGTDLLKLSEQEMQKVRGSQISMIFQDPMTALNPVLPVGKQIGECFSHSLTSLLELSTLRWVITLRAPSFFLRSFSYSSSIGVLSSR